MKIKNKRNMTNYVNFKSSGIVKKIAIGAGKIADIHAITSVTQIINFGDFNRGFFEIISEDNKKIENKEEQKPLKNVSKTTEEKEKKEDSLKKVEKEVKDYTDNKENKDNK